jgi:hypothetical protein
LREAFIATKQSPRELEIALGRSALPSQHLRRTAFVAVQV